MRTLGLLLFGGVLSLALLTAAPSAASAQRFRTFPAMPRPRAIRPVPRAVGSTTSHVRPNLGVLPSAFVGVATRYPYNPQTGTFSTVGVSSGFAVPTNVIAFRNAQRLQIARTAAYSQGVSRLNAYALYSGAYGNPYLGYSNPYTSMYSSGYGGGYGGYSGGYGGGYSSGYGGGYGTANPYLSYMNAVTQPAPASSIPSTAPALYNTVEVGVYDNRFEPASITISTGTTVRWTNYSNDKHSVTSDTGLWDSKGLNPGATTSYTFTQPGKYTYHSSLNGKLHGTVIVQ